MKKIYFLSAIILASAGMSSAQTFDLTWATQLQSTLTTTVASHGIRGASVAVYAPGMGMWQGTAGISSTGVPVTPDMEFGIGSNTKLFVATLMLKLQEQGILSLDDHLYQWLPSFQYIDSSATIRQLLNHQTGFSNYTDNPSFWGDSLWADTSRAWTEIELLSNIGPPHFPVGEGFYYSNTNYVLAAMIVQAATSQPWYQQLRTQILTPLNLDSTFAGYYEPAVGTIAHPLVNDTLEILNPPMTAENTIADAAGSMFSNASEMALWYFALFTGQVISDASMQQLLEFEAVSLYGLGVGYWAGPDGNIAYVHSGQVLGYTSQMWFNKKTGAAMCILTNNASLGLELFDPMANMFLFNYPVRPNDASISNVISPFLESCNTAFVPQVVLKNKGSNTLTSTAIYYSIDGSSPGNFNWNGSLTTGDSTMVSLSLSSINLAAGSHVLKCYTSLPNGSNDDLVFNDTVEFKFTILSTTQPALYFQDFESTIFPPANCLANPDDVLGWRRTSLAYYLGGHASMARNNYSDQLPGKIYDFDLTNINLNAFNNPQLSFELAYSNFPGYYDSLAILVSTDCGATWQSVFHNGGVSLSTAGSNTSPFFATTGDWETKQISLTAFAGDAIIRFRLINGYGNNMYIDNISLQDATSVPETSASVNWNLHPNPFNESSTLSIDREINNGSLIIYDYSGKKVDISNSISGKQIPVERKNLANGLYFFQLVENGTSIVSGKFVVN